MSSPPARTALSAPLLLLGLLLVVGCGESPPPAIPRATFVEAYLALREATILAPRGQITEQARDSILQARELTSDDLLHFVEVHGRDPIFMGRIWEEIDTELAARQRAAAQAAGVS